MVQTTPSLDIRAIYHGASPWARVLLLAMLVGAAVGGVYVGYRVVGPASEASHLP